VLDAVAMPHEPITPELLARRVRAALETAGSDSTNAEAD
jgi:hypothetical protein